MAFTFSALGWPSLEIQRSVGLVIVNDAQLSEPLRHQPFHFLTLPVPTAIWLPNFSSIALHFDDLESSWVSIDQF